MARLAMACAASDGAVRLPPQFQPGHAQVHPFLLDVQANLLDALATRVVVPLILAEEMGLTAKYLNPQFKIKGVVVVMSTAELAGIPKRSLGDKVASLKSKRDEIIAELDFPVYRNLIQSLRPWFASME